MSTVTLEFPVRVPAPTGRRPRVTRLLALAHTIDARIRSGKIRNWAEAARLLGVTRARMTQIAHLLSLSPAIQERVLTLPLVTRGPDPVTERALRIALVHPDWPGQERALARPDSPAAGQALHPHRDLHVTQPSARPGSRAGDALRGGRRSPFV